ncbi:MAG: glycoside hydrolase 43 family protein [Coprobacillus sp.]|nr:glycoside hydrolase 43 family protein [Coprobacillus sp.]
MTYRNPVLEQDFSDPDVIRRDDRFYMVSSSFNYSPALPVLESVNLVEWKLVNYVMKELPKGYETVRPGEGVWAPSLRYHAGSFYCVFPLYGEGIYMCRTDDVLGEWTKPVRILEGEGLEDPCPIWTEDGRAYMAVAYAKSKAGFNSRIDVCEMTRDLKERLSPFRTVYDGSRENPIIEGPKFYFKDGFFYILAPAGGVRFGWQVALRSRSVWGPYKAKTVLARGGSDINGPHQGALVDLPDGGWAFVHFRDMGAYGRVTYLEPVIWEDGWPVPGEKIGKNGCGSPVSGGDFPVDATNGDGISFDDDFHGGVSAIWQTPAVCEKGWFDAEGGLTLHARPPLGGIHSFPYVLTQRFPAFSFTAETEIDVSELEGFAGMCVLGKTSYLLELTRDGGDIRIIFAGERGDENATKPILSRKRNTTFVRVGLMCRPEVKGSHTYAVCRFTIDGEPFAKEFAALQGVWMGARIGLFAMGGGDARIGRFRVLCV